MAKLPDVSGPEYNYLGRFREKRHLERGHNENKKKDPNSTVRPGEFGFKGDPNSTVREGESGDLKSKKKNRLGLHRI